MEKSDDIPGKYTDLQKNNIRYWKFLYRFEVATPKFLNQFAVVDVSPDKLPIETDEGCQQSLSKIQNTSSACKTFRQRRTSNKRRCTNPANRLGGTSIVSRTSCQSRQTRAASRACQRCKTLRQHAKQFVSAKHLTNSVARTPPIG